MLGSVASIETFGLVDGPGIRTVVFLNGCKLRCRYCHNPEMWTLGEKNMDANTLVERILRNKNYFGEDGGITFSGGEPLLQADFIIEVVKILKKENIHITLDTAGVGLGNYKELLSYIDLIIFDVKHTDVDGYQVLTGQSMEESLRFIEVANSLKKKFWIRQVIVPGIMDNDEYMNSLLQFLKKIDNIEKIEFLPYHKFGSEKYEKLGIKDPYKYLSEMDIERCNKLYNQFMQNYAQERTVA